MDPTKFAEIQAQMRHNQHDYSDFLKDLDGWSEEIKKKEQALKNQDEEKKKSLPPVRNSLHKKKKKKVKKQEDTTKQEGGKQESKGNRISGYDFRAWDKFDVDRALQDMDEKASSSSSELETDEEWEEERAKQMANLLKDQGNQYFKEGKYDEAIDAYTRGIITDGSNAILPANRAMALLKQGKYAAAEVDCSQSITLDPMYIKAYARRGAARHAMGKLELAKADFERVLKLEPGNKQAKQDLETVTKKLNSGLEATEESGIVKPIYKPPEKRSKKPLKRITIEEIGEDADERQQAIQKTVAKQSEVKRKTVEQEEKLFAQFTKLDTKESDSDIKSKNNHSLDKPDTEKSKNDNANKMQLNFNDSLVKQEEAQISSSASPASSPRSPASPLSVSSNSTPSSSPRIPPVPHNSFQFQKDWHLLKDDPSKFYQYFKEIPPSQYSRLFGQALESDMLVMVLNTLHQYYASQDKDFYNILVNLATVKRFAMTVMFFSEKDKKVISDLFTHLEMKGQHSTSDISTLKKKYGV